MTEIHPTAIVAENAEVADDVRIGPYCVIEGDTVIGEGTVLREHVVIRRYTQLGRNNTVGAHAVLGGEPQDLKFTPDTVSHLRIGDGNVFRENVTISRATTPGGATVVGDGTYWMANSHAGHDARIGDACILANGVNIAGHANIGDRAILSGNVLVHQFCRVGELVMAQGRSATGCHVPPFTILVGASGVAGLNAVGLRRAGDISDEDRRQIKEAFRITYRSGLTPSKAVEKMDACTDFGRWAGMFREFIREVVEAKPPHKRPLAKLRSGSEQD